MHMGNGAYSWATKENMTGPRTYVTLQAVFTPFKYQMQQFHTNVPEIREEDRFGDNGIAR